MAPNERLTDRKVGALRPEAGRRQVIVWDALLPGFGVRASDTARSWVVRVQIDGRRSMRTIGRYPTMTLQDARSRAREILDRARSGIDPDLYAAQERTLADVAEDFLAWSRENKRSWREDDRYIRGDVLPVLGRKRPIEITRADCRDAIGRVMDRGAPVAANRCRAALSRLMAWCVAADLADHNAVRDVAPMARERPRERVLSDDEIRAFWRAAEDDRSVVGACLRALLLTGKRKSETACQRWEWVSGDWIGLPGEVTKNGRDDAVFITPQLRRVWSLTEGSGSPWIYPSASSAGHLVEVRKPGRWRLRGDWRPHDLRRTFATRLAARGVSVRIIELCLGHTRTRVSERVYIRHRYAEEMAAAWRSWGEDVERIVE